MQCTQYKLLAYELQGVLNPYSHRSLTMYTI